MYYLKCEKCGEYFDSDDIHRELCDECQREFEMEEFGETFDHLQTITGHDDEGDDEPINIDDDEPEIMEPEEELEIYDEAEDS